MKKIVYVALLSVLLSTVNAQIFKTQGDQSVIGRMLIAPSGTTSDNGYNGNVVITKPVASGQYINLIRQGMLPWSIGMVYNTSKFAIGNGTSTDASFTNPYFVIDNANGNVGIGTPAPGYKLDIAGNARVTNELYISGAGSDIGGSLSIMNTAKTSTGQASKWSIYNMSGSYGNSLQFWAYDNIGCTSGGTCNSRLILMDNGNVGIGTSPLNINDKLTVNGTIHASEVKVDMNNLADFVFHPSYNLMPLNQVEQFVKTNNHLPEIPSAAEVQKNGLSMGEMQNKLLQKIEELTLYVIEQQKQIDELKRNQK